MKEIYNNFLIQFCKVDFVCENTEPNWLGWVFIAIVCWFTLAIIFTASVNIYGLFSKK